MEKFGAGAAASTARFRSSQSGDLKASDSFPGSFPGKKGWGGQDCTHSLLKLSVSKRSLHTHSLREFLCLEGSLASASLKHSYIMSHPGIQQHLNKTDD